jgi:hypothetical protein
MLFRLRVSIKLFTIIITQNYTLMKRKPMLVTEQSIMEMFLQIATTQIT